MEKKRELVHVCKIPDKSIRRTTLIGHGSEYSGLAIIMVDDEEIQDIISQKLNNSSFFGGMAKADKIKLENNGFEFGIFLTKFYGVSSLNFKRNVNSTIRNAMKDGIVKFEMPLMNLETEYEPRSSPTSFGHRGPRITLERNELRNRENPFFTGTGSPFDLGRQIDQRAYHEKRRYGDESYGHPPPYRKFFKTEKDEKGVFKKMDRPSLY